MDGERLPDAAPAETKPKETSGEYLLRVLRPAGCIAVLAAMVLMLVICFTHKSDPVTDYVPTESAEYYAASPEALARELKTRLLVYFPGADCAVEDGRVAVTAPAESMETLRETLLLHFDEKLITIKPASD